MWMARTRPIEVDDRGRRRSSRNPAIASAGGRARAERDRAATETEEPPAAESRDQPRRRLTLPEPAGVADCRSRPAAGGAARRGRGRRAARGGAAIRAAARLRDQALQRARRPRGARGRQPLRAAQGRHRPQPADVRRADSRRRPQVRATSSTRSWCASWPTGGPRRWDSDAVRQITVPRLPTCPSVDADSRVLRLADPGAEPAGSGDASRGADLRQTPQVSADFDAEFARAADLLEAGKRAEAEAHPRDDPREAPAGRRGTRASTLLLGERRRAARRRRGRSRASARHLRRADRPRGLPAISARAGARARGLGAETRSPLRALAFEAEGPLRLPAARRDVARALCSRRASSRGRPREVLALGAPPPRRPRRTSPRSRFARIRLGLARGDAAAVRGAARDLLLEAPTTDAAKSTPPAVRAAARRGRDDAHAGGAGAPRHARWSPRVTRAAASPCCPATSRRRGRRGARRQPARARAGAARAEAGPGGRGDGGADSRRRHARVLRGAPVSLRPRRSRGSGASGQARCAPDDPRWRSGSPRARGPDGARRAGIGPPRRARAAPSPGRGRRATSTTRSRMARELHRAGAGGSATASSRSGAGVGSVRGRRLRAARGALRGACVALRRRLARRGASPTGGRGASRPKAGTPRRGRSSRRSPPPRRPISTRAFARVRAPAGRRGRAAGAHRPVDGDGGVRAGRRAAAAAPVRGGVGRGAHASCPRAAATCGMAQADFALGPLPDGGRRDQARASGDRHGRGGPRAGRLAAPLLPDRGGRLSCRARRGVRPGRRRCCAASCGRRACSTRTRNRGPARWA